MEGTPVFLPGESHGQRSLAGYSPRGCKESDTAEATESTHTLTLTHTHTHAQCNVTGLPPGGNIRGKMAIDAKSSAKCATFSPWDFPGKNTGMGCHFLLRGSNPGLPHCRQML